jgi:hypothetical protein
MEGTAAPPAATAERRQGAGPAGGSARWPGPLAASLPLPPAPVAPSLPFPCLEATSASSCAPRCTCTRQGASPPTGVRALLPGCRTCPAGSTLTRAPGSVAGPRGRGGPRGARPSRCARCGPTCRPGTRQQPSAAAGGWAAAAGGAPGHLHTLPSRALLSGQGGGGVASAVATTAAVITASSQGCHPLPLHAHVYTRSSHKPCLEARTSPCQSAHNPLHIQTPLAAPARQNPCHGRHAAGSRAPTAVPLPAHAHTPQTRACDAGWASGGKGAQSNTHPGASVVTVSRATRGGTTTSHEGHTPLSNALPSLPTTPGS